MSPEDRQLLEENLKLSKENNLLLIKLANYQKWAQITKIFYWVLIIGISVGAFYSIKPYFGNLLNVYSGDVSGIKSLNSFTGGSSEKDSIKDLLKSLTE